MNSRPEIARTELPAELRTLIQKIRQRLRRYSVLSGLLGLIIAASLTFWATTGLDTGWFALQRLELPVGLRAALLAIMLVSALWLLFRSVILPLLRRIHDRDLALLLERRFPEFQDRLITAVEGTQELPLNGPLMSQMLTRTVSEAKHLAQRTQPEDVFNHQPLKQRGWIAGILMLSVAGIGATAPETLPRWWNAFVRCETVYHKRTTHLEVHVIQQPGDRRLPFHTESETHFYLHPRGNDLELELIVPDGLSPSDQPWVVPKRVRVDVRRSDGTTSRTYVSPTSDRTFRYMVTRLQEDVTIELLAGDFRIPEPLIVQSVAPPDLDKITIQCNYPKYTHWNQLRSTTLDITGSEISLPIGTHFRLEATSSKLLRSARIATDLFELSGDTESSHLDFRGGGDATGPSLLSPDEQLIKADFQLLLDDSSKTPVENGKTTVAPQDNVLTITPNTSLKFTLHDQDNVVSTRPLVFRVQGIKDRPPAIDIRTGGIDSAITRRAVIPFSGSVRDDYGLHATGFEFIVDDESNWRPRPFSSPFTKDTTEFILGEEATPTQLGAKPELFRVQPLDLTEGQTLSIALTATDGCTIGVPNVTRGDPFVFRVVSNEEMLSLLYTREINLRRRFEEALREIQQVRDDLGFHEQMAKRIETAGDDAKPEDRIGLTTCATRSGNTLRRQTNELKSVLLGFDGIIRQLINNAVPPAQLSETMRDNIVIPLQEVVETDLPKADRAASRFRVAATSRQPSLALITESEKQVAQVITRLKQVLESIRNMAEFHEVLSDLRAVQEEQKRIQRDTKRLKRQRLIDNL